MFFRTDTLCCRPHKILSFLLMYLYIHKNNCPCAGLHAATFGEYLLLLKIEFSHIVTPIGAFVVVAERKFSKLTL